MSELERMSALGPLAGIGWLLKALVLIGKLVYRLVRVVMWILRRIFPKK